MSGLRVNLQLKCHIMSDFSQNAKPTLSLGESLTAVFNQYATFTGRARRSEYWWFALANAVLSIILYVAQLWLLFNGDDTTLTIFFIFQYVLGIALFIPSLAVSVRRFHDIGKSGWNFLWVLIPIVGVILLIVWFSQDSDVNSNKYGPSPKYS